MSSRRPAHSHSISIGWTATRAFFLDKGSAKAGFRRRHSGFSIVELLVVGCVLFLLLALLLPALVRAQSTARRTQCANNLQQIGIALSVYHSDMNMFPPGCVDRTGPVLNAPTGYQFGWIVQFLPYMDQYNLYQQIDLSAGVHESVNPTCGATVLRILTCPSDEHGSAWGSASSSYAGCVGGSERQINTDSSGVLFLNSSISERQITDGTSNTILVGETRFNQSVANAGLGWMSGSAATLGSTAWPINAPLVDAATDQCGGFGSYHGNMAQCLFADGSIRPLATELDPQVLENLGNRSDGELISVRTKRDEQIDQNRRKALEHRTKESP